MTFEQKYTSDNFEKVLSENFPKSTAAVIAEVGCGRNTAKRYLTELEKTGKIKKALIGGSIYYGWLRVPESEPVKEPEPSRKTKEELEDTIHFWCCIDEFREEHPNNQVAQLVCTLIRGADPELYDNCVVDVKKVDSDLARLREWLLK
jgi:hypothetical protein